MELLKKFDEQNYKDTTSVFEKYTIRGIIVRDGKIAALQGIVTGTRYE